MKPPKISKNREKLQKTLRTVSKKMKDNYKFRKTSKNVINV